MPHQSVAERVRAEFHEALSISGHRTAFSEVEPPPELLPPTPAPSEAEEMTSLMLQATRNSLMIVADEIDTHVRKHGKVAETLPRGLDDARRVMEGLAAAGINLAEITDRLVEQGVELFSTSYEKILKSLGAKIRD